jgi:hypothetical protein
MNLGSESRYVYSIILLLVLYFFSDLLVLPQSKEGWIKSFIFAVIIIIIGRIVRNNINERIRRNAEARVRNIVIAVSEAEEEIDYSRLIMLLNGSMSVNEITFVLGAIGRITNMNGPQKGEFTPIFDIQPIPIDQFNLPKWSNIITRYGRSKQSKMDLGRSYLALGIFVINRGICKNADEAHDYIKQCRPHVHWDEEQMHFLKKITLFLIKKK